MPSSPFSWLPIPTRLAAKEGGGRGVAQEEAQACGAPASELEEARQGIGIIDGKVQDEEAAGVGGQGVLGDLHCRQAAAGADLAAGVEVEDDAAARARAADDLVRGDHVVADGDCPARRDLVSPAVGAQGLALVVEATPGLAVERERLEEAPVAVGEERRAQEGRAGIEGGMDRHEPAEGAPEGALGDDLGEVLGDAPPLRMGRDLGERAVMKRMQFTLSGPRSMRSPRETTRRFFFIASAQAAAKASKSPWTSPTRSRPSRSSSRARWSGRRVKGRIPVCRHYGQAGASRREARRG